MEVLEFETRLLVLGTLAQNHLVATRCAMEVRLAKVAYMIVVNAPVEVEIQACPTNWERRYLFSKTNVSATAIERKVKNAQITLLVVDLLYLPSAMAML